MKPTALARRALALRARPLGTPGRLALIAAGAAAWTVLFIHEGRALERAGKLDHESPVSSFKRAGWLSLFKQAVSGWSRDQITRLAASLSYYTIFSVAPLALILIAVVGIFLGDDAARGVVSSQVTGFVGPEKARALEDMISAAQRSNAAGAAGLIGTLTVVLGASAVVGELQASLNQIFGARAAAAGFLTTIRRRIVSVGFVLGLGFLMLVSLTLAATTAAAGKFFTDMLRVPEAALQALNQAASFAVISTLFASMFRFLPDARMAWRDLWVGAAFTSALFVLGNLALGIYLGKGGPVSAYGAAGSLLAFLLWTYYCAQILYFGAEFTRAYALNRGRGIAARKRARNNRG